MTEVVSEALASGNVGSVALCVAIAFTTVTVTVSDRAARRVATGLRALRSGK